MAWSDVVWFNGAVISLTNMNQINYNMEYNKDNNAIAVVVNESAPLDVVYNGDSTYTYEQTVKINGSTIGTFSINTSGTDLISDIALSSYANDAVHKLTVGDREYYFWKNSDMAYIHLHMTLRRFYNQINYDYYVDNVSAIVTKDSGSVSWT